MPVRFRLHFQERERSPTRPLGLPGVTFRGHRHARESHTRQFGRAVSPRGARPGGRRRAKPAAYGRRFECVALDVYPVQASYAFDQEEASLTQRAKAVGQGSYPRPLKPAANLRRASRRGYLEHDLQRGPFDDLSARSRRVRRGRTCQSQSLTCSMREHQNSAGEEVSQRRSLTNTNSQSLQTVKAATQLSVHTMPTRQRREISGATIASVT
jgi:hypothetical protein